MNDSLHLFDADPVLLDLVAKLDVRSVVDSTQNIARQLAETGAPAWTLVVADHQTAGRGQGGHRWDGSPGAGLIFSVLLRPSLDALPLIPLRTGLAIADALDPLVAVGRAIMLKWPNDIVGVDATGSGKIGGVLCESQIRGDETVAIVGVGINVRPVPLDVGTRQLLPPAFLDTLLDASYPRIELLRRVVAALRVRLDASDPILSSEELRAFARRDWLAGQPILSPVAGRVQGISAQGHLCVEDAQGVMHHCATGTVIPVYDQGNR